MKLLFLRQHLGFERFYFKLVEDFNGLEYQKQVISLAQLRLMFFVGQDLSSYQRKAFSVE